MEEKEGYVIVVPGTLISTSEKSGEGTFVFNGKTYSKFFGIKKKGYKISVIPFKQSYKPKKWDKIIGQIKEFNYPFFVVDIKASLPAYLYLSDTSRYATSNQELLMKTYKPGFWIYSEISELSDKVKLSMKSYDAKVLKDGRIAYITPAKVPRVIGKEGSMIKMIQNKIGCTILVGQNGIIWVDGDKTNLVIKIIQKIDEESHIPGLTDRVGELIDKELKNGDKNRSTVQEESFNKNSEI